MSSIGHLVFFNGFFPKVNQIIRNTQRTTTSNLNAIQPTFHKISRPQAFWAAIFSKYPLSAILLLIIFFQKLIRSSEITSEPQHQIWMQSNQRFIWYRAHKLFGRTFFSKCPPSAILFLMNSSQKFIRSSEIPREPPIKFEWNPFKG